MQVVGIVQIPEGIDPIPNAQEQSLKSLNLDQIHRLALSISTLNSVFFPIVNRLSSPLVFFASSFPTLLERSPTHMSASCLLYLSAGWNCSSAVNMMGACEEGEDCVGSGVVDVDVVERCDRVVIMSAFVSAESGSVLLLPRREGRVCMR